MEIKEIKKILSDALSTEDTLWDDKQCLEWLNKATRTINEGKKGED